MINPWKGAKRRLRRKIVRDHLEVFLASHRTEECVLELGAGQSRYADYFPNRVALDFSKQRGVQVIADAHSLPFDSSSFSVALSTEMLEHAKNPQRVVDEIRRILRPGGKLILTTRFIFPIHDAPFDFFRFTKYGLRHMFREWVDIEIQPDTTPFEAIAVLFQRMAFQSDFYASKLVTGGCLLFAQIIRSLDRLIKTQYGDYKRKVNESQIMPSGYYVVAYKSQNQDG